jgi:hypothetical protein
MKDGIDFWLSLTAQANNTQAILRIFHENHLSLVLSALL